MRGPVQQVIDPQRQRHLLHAASNRRRPLAAALERERQLRAHAARHELRLGILEQSARERAQARRAVLARVQAGKRHAAGEAPAVEMGHETARGPQQRRLALSGQARQQAELARRELEADVLERRGIDTRIAVGDALERYDRPAHGSIPRRSQKGSATAAISATHSAAVLAPSAMCTCG